MAQGAQDQLHLPVVRKEGPAGKGEALPSLGMGFGGVGMGRAGSVLWEMLTVPVCSDSRGHLVLQGHFCSSLGDGTAAALTPCPLWFPYILSFMHLSFHSFLLYIYPSIHFVLSSISSIHLSFHTFILPRLPPKLPNLNFLPHFRRSLSEFDVSQWLGCPSWEFPNFPGSFPAAPPPSEISFLPGEKKKPNQTKNHPKALQ